MIDVTNQHTLLFDVTKMTAGGSVKVQPFHDYPITSGIGYLGDGIRVDYPNEIVMYVERKNDITTNYYNFVGLSGAVPDGVSIDIVDPFTVFTTEGAPDPQPPQTESGVLLAGGKSVVYKYAENPGGSLATVLLVGGYGSNSLTGGTMAFGNFVPAARIGEAKNHFGNLTGFDAAGQAYINARIDSVLAPASPAGIIGATMTGNRGGLMFGGPGNNSFFATGPGAYDMVGGAWTNNFTISPSFNGVPATYQIDGGPFGQSTLVVRVPATENVLVREQHDRRQVQPAFKALAVTRQCRPVGDGARHQESANCLAAGRQRHHWRHVGTEHRVRHLRRGSAHVWRHQRAGRILRHHDGPVPRTGESLFSRSDRHRQNTGPGVPPDIRFERMGSPLSLG